MTTDQPPIGEQIRTRRESFGIDVAALARMAQVSRTTLQLLEKGEVEPRGSTVRKVMTALDRFEEETGGPTTAEPPRRMATYRVKIGALDLEVTVEGPVEDADALREQMRHLIADLRADRPGS